MERLWFFHRCSYHAFPEQEGRESSSFLFIRLLFTDADCRGSAASFRTSSVICGASECLRKCVSMSPRRLSSVADPHYDEKSGRSLVKVAQIAEIDDAEA